MMQVLEGSGTRRRYLRVNFKIDLALRKEKDAYLKTQDEERNGGIVRILGSLGGRGISSPKKPARFD